MNDLPDAHLGDWDAARTALHATAARVARLVADTLRRQFPAAAYLVARRSEDDDVLHLHSVRDARGAILWDFDTGDRLPASTPPDSPLRTAWTPRDPGNPEHLAALVQELDAAGCHLDFMPEHLDRAAQGRSERDTPRSELCLLLSTEAEPGIWDDTATLRPYCAPRPAG